MPTSMPTPTTAPGKATIGNLVWEDTDKDGIKDPGETGIAGVPVELYRCNETTPIATVMTDAAGNYSFGNLDPGSYKIKFILPAGSTLSPKYDPRVDNTSSANPNGMTDCTDLAPGENDPTWDAGIIPGTVRIGDYVWHDENGNGRQDANEPALPAVKVCLEMPNGSAVMGPDGKPVCTVTNPAGKYLFAELPPGQYCVHFDLTTIPSGLVPTFEDMNGVADGLDSDAEASGRACGQPLSAGQEDMTLDMGLTAPTGIEEEDEPGIKRYFLPLVQQ